MSDICSKSFPKALALRGHDWETASSWGVIIGVCKCRSCGVVSSARHFQKIDVQAFGIGRDDESGDPAEDAAEGRAAMERAK